MMRRYFEGALTLGLVAIAVAGWLRGVRAHTYPATEAAPAFTGHTYSGPWLTLAFFATAAALVLAVDVVRMFAQRTGSVQLNGASTSEHHTGARVG